MTDTITAAMVLEVINHAGFDWSKGYGPYAKSYIAHLGDAEREYGAEGVRCQILYILNNLPRALTAAQVTAKRKLKAMSKGRLI
jgi:hypothetical protein